MYSCFKITNKLERERERESLALDINCPMLYAFIWKACLSPHVMWYLCVGSAIAYLLMTMNLLLLSFSFRPISSGYLKMNQDQTPFLTFNHACGPHPYQHTQFAIILFHIHYVLPHPLLLFTTTPPTTTFALQQSTIFRTTPS